MTSMGGLAGSAHAQIAACDESKPLFLASCRQCSSIVGCCDCRVTGAAAQG